jgi:hypothetical protein
MLRSHYVGLHGRHASAGPVSAGRFLLLAACAAAPILAQAPCVGSIPAGAPWATCFFSASPGYFGGQPLTSVSFYTADNATQALFDKAELCAAKNSKVFAQGFSVLVEGAGYGNVWLETQPLGGAMYGVRNLTLALNNQLVFLRTQRGDGRLPGMVTSVAPLTGLVNPTYSWPGAATQSMLQGFYLGSPSVDVAVLASASGAGAAAVAAYLAELQPALALFDSWLWAERNTSSGVPYLNSTGDTGEDNSDKFACIPSNCVPPPYESMDMAGYAHDAQRALARVAALRGDAAGAAAWAARAAATAAALKARLWRAELGAAFDRGRDGDAPFVTTLVHNNLRAMWHGAFDQEMADAFVGAHLMNTSEFWTPAPLPSISVSDGRFRDKRGNDWSGPPQGLTYQRTLRALSSYGHHAELTLAGAAQRAALLKTGTFPQQIEPFNATPDAGKDCYGPMLLAFLEYTALATGVAVRADPPALLWSALSAGAAPPPAFAFQQQLGASVFRLERFANGSWAGSRNGAPLFSASGGGARVVTSLDGVVTGVVGAGAERAAVALTLPGAPAPLLLDVAPNEEWAVDGSAPPVLARKVPFTPPF